MIIQAPDNKTDSNYRHLIQKARHCHKRVALNVGGVRYGMAKQYLEDYDWNHRDNKDDVQA